MMEISIKRGTPIMLVYYPVHDIWNLTFLSLTTVCKGKKKSYFNGKILTQVFAVLNGLFWTIFNLKKSWNISFPKNYIEVCRLSMAAKTCSIFPIMHNLHNRLFFPHWTIHWGQNSQKSLQGQNYHSFQCNGTKNGVHGVGGIGREKDPLQLTERTENNFIKWFSFG